MGPHRSVRILGILALLAVASASNAAELTRVVSSGDPGRPVGADISLRWERTQRSAKITREFAAGGSIADGTELRSVETTNRIVPRLAVGLWHDLELHLELPYVLNDDHYWRYGMEGGVSVESTSTIANNDVDPNGAPCTGICPIFPVGQTVYHGGKLGDIQAGVAWGIFSERRDDTKPTWVFGVDLTLPTAERYDPAGGRHAGFLSPYGTASSRGPFGKKVWVYDLYTALSRRLGPIDPYFKAHLRLVQKSGTTYSNCAHAAEMAAAGQMTGVAAGNCSSALWKDDAGAKPPVVAGIVFGTELIPYDNRAAGQQLSIDLRLGADYTSDARWYNELTDATGKLLATEHHLTVSGLFGIYYQMSKWFQLRVVASFENDLPHFLTGETIGKKSGDAVTPNSPEQNPNFDWRYDPPGRRFRISDVGVFNLGVATSVVF